MFSTFTDENIELTGVPVGVKESEVHIVFEQLIHDIEHEIPDVNFSISDLLSKSLAKSLAIKNGKKLELKYIIKDGNKSNNYTYNTIEKSSRASDFVYNKDGSVKEKNISRITTFYDKKWNEIGHTYYDSDGSIRRKGELKYDKKGNPILNVSFDYKTKKRRITEKKYNKYNDIVSWTIKVITEKDTTITNISEFKYLYDHKNNPVEVKSFSNGKILYKIRNKFLY